MIGFDLSEEQSLIRQTARDFAAREIAPHSREWDLSETMDRSIVGRLGEIGFLGSVLPEEYGGMGLDMISYCLVLEELGRVDSSVRGIVSVSLGLVGKTILRWGNDEQKRTWLPKIASGEALGCFGLTEASSGSDPSSLETAARRDGDEWVITGTKMFITNGSWAGVALIFARTGRDPKPEITAFLVPTDVAGFKTSHIGGKLGLRAQDTAELILDGVRVPDASRLGAVGKGLGIAMSALDNGRISLAAGCVGIAQACLDASVAYAKERTQFGRPIASFQLVQSLIADIAVETQAARLLTWHAAEMAERGERHSVQSSFAKYYASEVAVRAANAAVQVFGGYGYVDEYPVARFMRDARVTTLYEGTSQVHKLIIGRALTGINAFT